MQLSGRGLESSTLRTRGNPGRLTPSMLHLSRTFPKFRWHPKEWKGQVPNHQIKSSLPSGNIQYKTKTKDSYDQTKDTPCLALLSLRPEEFEFTTKMCINQLTLNIGLYFISSEWNSRRERLFLRRSHVGDFLQMNEQFFFLVDKFNPILFNQTLFIFADKQLDRSLITQRFFQGGNNLFIKESQQRSRPSPQSPSRPYPLASQHPPWAALLCSAAPATLPNFILPHLWHYP